MLVIDFCFKSPVRFHAGQVKQVTIAVRRFPRVQLLRSAAASSCAPAIAPSDIVGADNAICRIAGLWRLEGYCWRSFVFDLPSCAPLVSFVINDRQVGPQPDMHLVSQR